MQYEVINLSKNKILECLKDMDGKASRMLLYLACKADEDDMVEVIPNRLVKELNISKHAIVSSLKILRDLGIIHITGTSSNGLGHIYRVSVDDTDVERIIQTKLL